MDVDVLVQNNGLLPKNGLCSLDIIVNRVTPKSRVLALAIIFDNNGTVAMAMCSCVLAAACTSTVHTHDWNRCFQFHPINKNI